MPAFIKTHLISLASGLAALIFIVVGVLGMMSNAVVTKMEERINTPGIRDIASLKSSPKNELWIQREDERGRMFEKEYGETLEEAKRINARAPLMDNVFPKAENPAVAYEFRDVYARAIAQLSRGPLDGGDPPGPADISEAQNDLDEMAARKREESEGGGPTAPPVVPPVVSGAGRGGGPAIAGGGRSGPPAIAGGGRSSPPAIAGAGKGTAGGGPTGPLTAPGAALGDPKTDAAARAAVTKARSLRCYVNTDTARSTFHLSPILDANAKPLPAQMWYAQVGLWVQQDVINAIATLNEEAAKQLKPDDVYVENMPVKRIQSIRVLGYWGGNGPVAFPTYTGGGPGSGAPPAQMKETFTGRKSDARFDVIRFTVTAVVDQRELPKLIDFLTRQNFYTLIGLSFSAVTAADPDLSEGYLYGAAPVVRATLDFEGYLARSVYEGWFPDEVREALGIKGGP